MPFPPQLVVLLTLMVEESPEPEDVKAGWTALLVFVLLIAAVAFLGFSLVKQLRKAEAAKKAGLYGDAPEEAGTDSDNGSDSDHAR